VGGGEGIAALLHYAARATTTAPSRDRMVTAMGLGFDLVFLSGGRAYRQPAERKEKMQACSWLCPWRVTPALWAERAQARHGAESQCLHFFSRWENCASAGTALDLRSYLQRSLPTGASVSQKNKESLPRWRRGVSSVEPLPPRADKHTLLHLQRREATSRPACKGMG